MPSKDGTGGSRGPDVEPIPAPPSVHSGNQNQGATVQLESHATPLRESPQQRYANLHRAIERGLNSDEIWKELADVSLRLGHREEAVRCLQRIRGEATRLALESRLVRLGLIAPSEVDTAAAPAASNAGTEHAEHPEHRVLDHVVDAFQYLMHQHMPWLALVTMLAFPVVIGVGGFLTAGGSLLLLAAIAALPGLCVLGVVGAMGRQVLASSAEGHAEVPPLPGFSELLASARRFAIDAGLVLGTLVVPGTLAFAFGVPLQASLPLLAVGALLAPMAWVLRYLRNDAQALHPKVLIEAVRRTSPSYLALAPITVGLFVPAALVTWLTFGRPVWVQIAVVGPLCVLPIFIAARLLGTWIEAHRLRLGELAHGERRRPAAAAAETAAAPVATRMPKRPQGLEHFVAPVLKRHATEAEPPAPPTRRPSTVSTSSIVAKNAPQRPPQKPAPTPAAKPPAPRPATPANPTPAQPKAPARPASHANAPAAPARPAPRAIEGRGPQPRPSEAPVLASMPGAVVVSGADRKRQGAAARRP
jgi:hypothetical protein